MKKNIIISNDLITGIDILNTLNGGTIEPAIKLSQFAAYRQIDVKAPSIDEEGLHVKIENNKLIIFYEHTVESQQKPIPVPHVVYNKQIPFFIDTQKISAQYLEGVLSVQLPYNELANGYHRDVQIES
jgi:HSP20 family molecular chaperone IbpA